MDNMNFNEPVAIWRGIPIYVSDTIDEGVIYFLSINNKEEESWMNSPAQLRI